MQTLTLRVRRREIAEKIDLALWEWYSERGLDVPDWKGNLKSSQDFMDL